ncbi:MAG: hypothetical protein JWR80_6534 [Bradyrhizobium sp.]|nr:hypothetical protein [Bradyrhizobium sp.]
MNQIYVMPGDEKRCLESLYDKKPITITGLAADGKLRACSGVVQSVEAGHTTYPKNPIRVTILSAD